MYGTIYRQVLLPIHQRLRGRKTIRYWRDALANQWESREWLRERQWESLQALLRHAEAHCEFFCDQWKKVGFQSKSIQDVADFQRLPLLRRSDFRESRSRLRCRHPVGHVYSKSTGGSSGEPLKFDLCQDSHDRRVAMTYRGYDWAGAGPGARALLLWGRSNQPAGFLRRWKLDWHHRFDHQKWVNCFESKPEDMLRHHQTMIAYRPEVIIAYTNPVYEMAKFIESERLSVPRLKSILVGAEKLHTFQREKIESVFGARVFETYGSREFMLIGAECSEHSGLHLSIDNLFVEIVDDQGNPTPEGEVGNVVVTDLHNYAMPFIRYVTGDLAIAGFEMCACGRGLPLLQLVQGRQLDILQTKDGRRIPGEFFPHLMKDFDSVIAFQVEQTQLDHLIVRLHVNDHFEESVRRSLRESIVQVVGDSATIEWKEVDSIPLTPAGKRQVVINRLVG